MSEHMPEDVAEHVRRAAESVRRVAEGVWRVAEGVRSMSCHNVVSLRPDLHSSPLEKIEWVSNLCPIFIFPFIKGIRLGHF